MFLFWLAENLTSIYVKLTTEIWLADHWNLRHTMTRKVADGDYKKKFVTRNVAELKQDEILLL